MTNQKYNILIQGKSSKKRISNKELEVVPIVFYFRSKTGGINNSAKVGTSLIKASAVEYNQKWYHEEDVLYKTHELKDNWDFFYHNKTMQLLEKLPLIDKEIFMCADQIAEYGSIFKMELTPFGFSYISDKDKLNWMVDYLGQEKISEIYDSLPKNLDSIINKIKEFDSNTRENVFCNWYEDMGHHIFCSINEEGKKIELTPTIKDCIRAYQKQSKMYGQALEVRDEKEKKRTLNNKNLKIFNKDLEKQVTQIKRKKDSFTIEDVPLNDTPIWGYTMSNRFDERERKFEKKQKEFDNQIKDLEDRINPLNHENIDL